MIVVVWLIILGVIVAAMCHAGLAIRRYEADKPDLPAPADRHPFDLMS